MVLRTWRSSCAGNDVIQPTTTAALMRWAVAARRSAAPRLPADHPPGLDAVVERREVERADGADRQPDAADPARVDLRPAGQGVERAVVAPEQYSPTHGTGPLRDA